MNRIVVAALTIALLPAAALAQASDEQEVRAVINQYFHGHATGDPAEMRKAFWPTAHIEGIREGKFVSWTAEEVPLTFQWKASSRRSLPQTHD